MGTRKYHFPKFPRNHPMFRTTWTSKQLIDCNDHIVEVLQKYAEKSCPQSPRQILYLMTRHNESIFETIEGDGTSPKVKSSPKSLSPSKKKANVSSLKRKKLSFEGSTKSATQETEIPTETTKMDTSAQESTSSSGKAEMSEKSDTECPEEVFKKPAIPIKESEEESNPSKKIKLSDSSSTSDVTISEKKAETEEKMDISPIKDNKTDDSPSKSCKPVPVSPDKSKSFEKIQLLIRTIPVMDKNEIEFDMSKKSTENPIRTEPEIEHLVDDPSKVENVRKTVEDRLKADVDLKEPKGDLSPLKPNVSGRSPRRSRRINSPGRDTEKISGSDDPDIISSHPNVLRYLKMRFSSVLYYRNKYMKQIYQSLEVFLGDLSFLFYYAKNASFLVEDYPIEDKEYFTEDLKRLKEDIMSNTKKIVANLRLPLDTLKMDVPFWAKGLRQIRKLKRKYEPLVSEEVDPEKTVEYLRIYESNLRFIWEQMDSKIFLRNGLRPCLLEISADYVKLTEDIVKFLVMVEILKPSIIPTSEEVQEK